MLSPILFGEVRPIRWQPTSKYFTKNLSPRRSCFRWQNSNVSLLQRLKLSLQHENLTLHQRQSRGIDSYILKGLQNKLSKSDSEKPYPTNHSCSVFLKPVLTGSCRSPHWYGAINPLYSLLLLVSYEVLTLQLILFRLMLPLVLLLQALLLNNIRQVFLSWYHLCRIALHSIGEWAWKDLSDKDANEKRWQGSQRNSRLHDLRQLPRTDGISA